MEIKFLGRGLFYYFEYNENIYYTVDGSRFYDKTNKSKILDNDLILILSKAHEECPKEAR
jgi:ferredoxin